MTHRRAKEIFLDAIELPEGEREAFVDRECGRDAGLRGRVEDFLRLHAEAGGVPDLPAFALDQDWLASQRPESRARTEQPGDVVGRYRLIRAIGEGGFGTVFYAEQTEPVVRPVALKVVKRGMDTDQVIARFELERQALAMMDHPGIARVLDAGATDSGRPYFVMEYVDGRPITTFARERQLSVSQRLELIEQACLAVQHAHQKGIIHRDLKPSNILVTLVDDRPVVKVIDFGVAKAVDVDTAADRTVMTLETQIVGTPQYMSPEQATTGASQVDTRSDVYSLGTVLYELITGAPPFDPVLLRHAGIERLCQIIREETPAKPSTRITTAGETTASGVELRSLRRQVSGEIDWIVMKALEKEPKRRYQSPAELAEDIRLHLSNRAVRAGPPSRLYQLRKFARRHRVVLGAAMLVALSLVATAATATVLASRARRAEADARQQAALARQELARANAVVAFTNDLLGGIGPAVARGRDTALLRDLLDRSIARAGTSFAGQPTLELTVRNIIAEALYQIGDANGAVAQLRGPFDATADTPYRDDPERLRAGRLMTDVLFDQFEPALAEKIITDTLEGYRRSGRAETDDGYAARAALAGVYMRQRRQADAEKILRDVLEHFRATGQGESDNALRVWNNLALCLGFQDRWDQAVDEWKKLNDLDRRLFGDDHPFTLMTTINIGDGLHRLGRFEEAEKYLYDALAISRKIYPPGHPTLLTCMDNLGGLLLRQSKVDQAEPILVEAYETGRAKLGVMDTPLDAIHLELATVRYRQGRFEEGLVLAKALHDAAAAKYGERDMKTISTLTMVFRCLVGAGRPEEGIAMLKQVGDIPPELTGETLIQVLCSAGQLYLAAGDTATAKQYATRARAALPTGRTPPWALRDFEKKLAGPATTQAGT